MSNRAQLESLIISLKLSGLADNLELRLIEAEQSTELLTMMFNDEIEKRNNRRLKRLITKAKLKSNQTLEHFDFSFNPSINAAAISVVSRIWLLPNVSLLLAVLLTRAKTSSLSDLPVSVKLILLWLLLTRLAEGISMFLTIILMSCLSN